ncbi:MAG: hypothetical protein VYC34_12455, partial [Planctomycetota bacterium]|nr:hypothetical protein [Planctomycetota bacterium]
MTKTRLATLALTAGAAVAALSFNPSGEAIAGKCKVSFGISIGTGYGYYGGYYSKGGYCGPSYGVRVGYGYGHGYNHGYVRGRYYKWKPRYDDCGVNTYRRSGRVYYSNSSYCPPQQRIENNYYYYQQPAQPAPAQPAPPATQPSNMYDTQPSGMYSSAAPRVYRNTGQVLVVDRTPDASIYSADTALAPAWKAIEEG